MSANDVNTRTSRTLPALQFFVGLIAAIIIGQTWWSIEQDRQLSLESEKANALVAVRGLEEHANQILHGADRAIDAVVSAIQNDDELLFQPERLRYVLLREQRDTAYLQSIRYLDINGISQITSFAQVQAPIDVSDRGYVRYLRDHPDRRETLIGHAVKSRYDNQWIVPVVRNLFDAAGNRVGMVAAYIRVAYFEQFYRRVAKDNQAIVSLYSNDGYVLARSPFDESLFNRSLATSTVGQRIRAGAREGSFVDRFSVGHEPRSHLFTYHKFSDFHVTSVYARDLGEVMAAWHSRNSQRIVFAFLAGACLLALALLLAIHIRRLHDSSNQLAASEGRYRILFEGAKDAILLWNRHGIYVDCNQAAADLFGVADRKAILGRKVGAFSPPDQPQEGMAEYGRQAYIRATLEGTSQRYEWSTLRHGKLCHNDVTLSRAEINGEPMVLGIFHDISIRKRTQALQDGQNSVLHEIAAGNELDGILTAITRFVEQHTAHCRCVILLLHPDESHFSYAIGPSLPEQVARLPGMPVASDIGCCGDAVLSRCPVVVEDLAASPAMARLQEYTGALDFASSASWPIMGRRGQILGALSLLYVEPQQPDLDDMQVVGISTDLAGIAIESRRAEERILHLAHYDELTGLPNRFLFIQHLDKALAHAERQHGRLAVLFLDLDRFKNINDTFGHEAGDQVLRDTAGRMREALRDQDTIARVGGDEFLALVEDYRDPRKLGEIAERLLVAAAAPFKLGDDDYRLSVSIGIAIYPDDGIDTQALLKNADIAMYRAKATGRDNYQFYSAEMNIHTVERAALETRLRSAIEQREFVMHYQPKVDVDSGRIVGAEALVRWHHPQRGLLFPGEFIPLAEEAGLIGQLGMLVLDLACQDIAAFERTGRPFGRVAINLSAAQFNQASLLDQLRATVAAHGVSPSSIEFEITESMIMHNREQATEVMKGLRGLGCTLSIDDFGTGYSSLAYLKRFPVNSVKIDRSFISDIPQGPNDSAIVQAIIAMAHTLGLEAIAEGVETGLQLQTLQKFGCNIYQGFHFSKAIPADDFMQLLDQHQPDAPAARYASGRPT